MFKVFYIKRLKIKRVKLGFWVTWFLQDLIDSFNFLLLINFIFNRNKHNIALEKVHHLILDIFDYFEVVYEKDN